MKQDHCIRACPDETKLQHCMRLLASINSEMHEMACVFNLVGNEVRLKILYLLHQKHDLCVCDLSDILGLSISAVSQHLRKLKDGGVIRDRKSRQTVFYYITPKYLILTETLLQPLRQILPA